jgi:hypothetical protein
MFARRSAHNDPQSILETPGMMPNFAGVEKFFTHMAFKTSGALACSCQKQLSPREILNAKARSRAVRQGGSRGHTEERP